MRSKPLIAAALAVVFAASCAHMSRDNKVSSRPSAPVAQANDGGAEAMFRSLDKNNDGYISRDEARGTAHERDFDALDRNRDGRLSREEHAAAPQHRGTGPRAAGETPLSAGGAGGTGGSTSAMRY